MHMEHSLAYGNSILNYNNKESLHNVNARPNHSSTQCSHTSVVPNVISLDPLNKCTHACNQLDNRLLSSASNIKNEEVSVEQI